MESSLLPLQIIAVIVEIEVQLAVRKDDILQRFVIIDRGRSLNGGIHGIGCTKGIIHLIDIGLHR